MFRENLTLAKAKFGAYVQDRANFVKIPHAKRQLEVLTHLIQKTFNAYGEVGIYDPEALASIDFLNKPELLVQLVTQSANRGSRKLKLDMLKMSEVTSKWMQYMVRRAGRTGRAAQGAQGVPRRAHRACRAGPRADSRRAASRRRPCPPACRQHGGRTLHAEVARSTRRSPAPLSTSSRRAPRGRSRATSRL